MAAGTSGIKATQEASRAVRKHLAGLTRLAECLADALDQMDNDALPCIADPELVELVRRTREACGRALGAALVVERSLTRT